jgi:hypothetical protein
MPNRLILLVSIGFSLLACHAPSVPEDSANFPIVGGTLHDGDPAVPLLDLGPLGGYCTGTMITDRIALTAAHCLAHPEDMLVRFVNEATVDDRPEMNIIDHDIPKNSDLAIIALATPADFMTPVPFNTRSLKGLLGQEVRLVGFGATGESEIDFGIKRLGYTTLEHVAKLGADVRSDEMVTSNKNGQGTCYGDSGGPNFMKIDGVEHIVAVTSRGTDACGAGMDIAVRTDAHRDFITKFIKKNDPVHVPVIDDKGGGCHVGGAANLLLTLLMAFLTLGLGCDSSNKEEPQPAGEERATELPDFPPDEPVEAREDVAEQTGFIKIDDESTFQTEVIRMLEIARKPMLTPEDEAALLEFRRQHVDTALEQDLAEECEAHYREGYRNKAEREKKRLRDEWVKKPEARTILVEKAKAVNGVLRSNRVAADLYFDSELFINTMYMARRQQRAIGNDGNPIAAVEKVIRDCSARLRVDPGHYEQDE